MIASTGGAAAQLALDDTEDAALLAGDEDTTGILRVVAARPLVDIGPLHEIAGGAFRCDQQKLFQRAEKP